MSRALNQSPKSADIHAITALLDGVAFPATDSEILAFAAAHAERVQMPVVAIKRVQALPTGTYYSLSETLRALEEETPDQDVYVCPECGGSFKLS